MVKQFAGTGERIRVNQAAHSTTPQRLESQPPQRISTAARFRTEDPKFSPGTTFPQLSVSVSDLLAQAATAEYRVKVLP
jgi:hypothetical protein